MQERGFTLKGIVKGLRYYSDTPVNSEELIECYNLIPAIQGLTTPPDITPIDVEVDHPFPQIFFGTVHWLLCTRTKVYTINGDLSLTLLRTVGNGGGIWEFVDYFEFGILTNGNSTLVYNTTLNQWEDCDRKTIPLLSTACNFNGQLIGAAGNTLMWSKIGSADFTIDQSNVAGSRVMPWFGEIYRVLKLGSSIAVYGSNGIAICKFNGVVLSVVRILKFGILSRGAVGGSDSAHVFIDTSGNFRVISEDGEVSTPMYKEFFSPMISRDVIISYDSTLENFYINDGVRCFIYNKNGLGEVSTLVTSIDTLGGILYGTYSQVTNTYAEIITGDINFGNGSKKSIDIIEVGGSGESDIEVSVGWRNTIKDEFSYTPYTLVNNEGIVTIPVSGIEFRIKVKSDNYQGFKLYSITIRVKLDDLRSTRGINNVN